MKIEQQSTSQLSMLRDLVSWGKSRLTTDEKKED